MPLFIATEQFTPASQGWQRYIAWSELTQLTEVVSLDTMLCPSVLTDVRDEDWPRIVNENFMPNYFHDLDYLRGRAGDLSGKNLLCVWRNPEAQPIPPPELDRSFAFEGYDLVELATGVSALANCGGFPAVFSNAELTSHGLLPELARANEVQAKLRELYPEEPHACCDVWAIYRA